MFEIQVCLFPSNDPGTRTEFLEKEAEREFEKGCDHQGLWKRRSLDSPASRPREKTEAHS